MGLLDKVKGGVSAVASTINRAAEAVEQKVATAASAVETRAADAAASGFQDAKDFARLTGQKLESVASAASGGVRLNPLTGAQQAFQVLAGNVPGDPHVGGAGRSDFAHPAKAEAAVRGNAARNTQWTTEEIKKNPDAFLQNVVQIDGINATDSDYTSCGPTALMMGMLAGRPESVPELAGKLIDDKGEFTDAGRKLFGPDVTSGALKDAVKRIRDGKFSAADVTLMSEGFLDGIGRKPDGTKAEDLIALRATIGSLGVSVPRMELQQFGSPDGGIGHWRVGVNDKQYNPWPNDKGQSTVIAGPAGLADGGSDGKGWVNREKIYIDDTGASRNVYAITTKDTPAGAGQTWAVTNDPPLFIARYEKQADGTYKRNQLDAQRFQSMAKDQKWEEISDLFPSVSPR